MLQCSNKGERLGYEGSGSGPGLTLVCDFLSFFIKTLSITGQKFSKCLKNGSDRLRRGQLRRLCWLYCASFYQISSLK